MSVKLEDRPIEQVREEVIDKLIVNYSHGIISAEAFERRLDQAMESTAHQEIVALAADLPKEPDQKFENTRAETFATRYGAAPEEDSVQLNCVIGSAERSGQWLVPKRIKVLNVLGSVKLDFSEAIFHHQQITVEVLTVLGSDEIFVPEDVNVVCKAFGILGSIENKAVSVANRQAPTITIEGKSILASLEVSIRRTIKEKFVAFAKQMKAVFQSHR